MSKSKRSGRTAERWGEALKGGTDEFYPGHGKDKVLRHTHTSCTDSCIGKSRLTFFALQVLSIAWNIVGDHLASGGADRSSEYCIATLFLRL